MMFAGRSLKHYRLRDEALKILHYTRMPVLSSIKNTDGHTDVNFVFNLNTSSLLLALASSVPRLDIMGMEN